MNFEQFHVLGETIRSELFLANNDEQKLPQIAACALSRADLETDLDLNAIGEFLRTTPVRQQPRQTSVTYLWFSIVAMPSTSKC